MAFEIKIKPLVVFDLEDRIKLQEDIAAGAGKQYYENFLSALTELQQQPQHANPVYESVRKYTTQKFSCNLFYMINGETIFIMGLL